MIIFNRGDIERWQQHCCRYLTFGKNSVFNHFMSIPRTILYITRVAEVDWLSANAKNAFNTFFGR